MYACEVQVDYTARALVKPLLVTRAQTIEVKESVENRTTNDIQLRLRNSVFSGRCTNWYIGEFGRNAASWPGLAIEFWIATLAPDRDAFLMEGGSKVWRLKSLWRTFGGVWVVLGAVSMGAFVYNQGVQNVFDVLTSKLHWR